MADKVLVSYADSRDRSAGVSLIANLKTRSISRFLRQDSRFPSSSSSYNVLVIVGAQKVSAAFRTMVANKGWRNLTSRDKGRRVIQETKNYRGWDYIISLSGWTEADTKASVSAVGSKIGAFLKKPVDTKRPSRPRPAPKPAPKPKPKPAPVPKPVIKEPKGITGELEDLLGAIQTLINPAGAIGNAVAKALVEEYQARVRRGESLTFDQTIARLRKDAKEVDLDSVLALTALGGAAKASAPIIQAVGKSGAEKLGKEITAKSLRAFFKNPDEAVNILLGMTKKEADKLVNAFKLVPRKEVEGFFAGLRKVDVKARSIPVLTHARGRIEQAWPGLLKALPPDVQTLFAFVVTWFGLDVLAKWGLMDNLGFYLTAGIRDMVRLKQFEEAQKAIDNARNIYKNLEGFIKGNHVLNFLTDSAFPTLFDSLMDKLDADQAILDAERGIEVSPAKVEFIGFPNEVEITLAGITESIVSGNTIETKLGSMPYSISAPGYKTKKGSVFTKRNEIITVSYDLEREDLQEPRLKPGATGISFDAKDLENNRLVFANWIIDGTTMETNTTNFAAELSAGAHEVVIEAFGYETFADNFIVDENHVFKQTFKLRKDPALQFGRLTVRSSPEGADVLVAGQFLGTTEVELALDPGTHEITIASSGFREETHKIFINAGESKTLSVKLEPEGITGDFEDLFRVDISSNPNGAKILINDSFTGKFTPDFIILKPGKYILKLVKSGFEDFETEINVGE